MFRAVELIAPSALLKAVILLERFSHSHLRVPVTCVSCQKLASLHPVFNLVLCVCIWFAQQGLCCSSRDDFCEKLPGTFPMSNEPSAGQI